jgi:hypothetical protein
MKQAVQELEKLRLMVEAGSNMTGMLYDYLDRGFPSDDQQSLTWQALKILDERDQRLTEMFRALFGEIIGSNPAVIEEWAGRHIRICSEVLERARAQDSGYPDPGLEELFARSHGKDWERVAAGEELCIVQHSLMMQYHRDLQEREFGRIEGVDHGLPRYPWKKDE